MTVISKTNRKRHTKPCLYFQTNDCPLSAEDCDFSHVIVTPEQYEALKNPQSTLRTKPCRFFLGGKCRDGYWCRFKHPANSFATSRESDASLLEDVPELDSDKSTTEDDDVDVRDLDGWKAKPEEHPKYRTRPCRNFILGKCIYGERCSYLHILASPDTPSPGNAVHVTPGRTVSPSPVRSTVSSFFPTTPPLRRVPPTTRITTQESQSDSSGTDAEPFDLDASSFRTPVRTRFNSVETSSDMQTPSTASSGSSDEPPMTPAGATEYTHPFLCSSGSSSRVPPLPTFPLSPLSPLSLSHAQPRDYLSAKAASRGPLSMKYMNNLPLSPLSPLSPQPLSMSMYPPTTPMSLQIVHVPFAVPMYPEMPLSPNTTPHASSTSNVNTPRRISVSTLPKSPPQTLRTRGRAFSQPDVSVVPTPTSPESLLYRSKPCKFFAETGKCQKGDECNFSHDQVTCAPITPNEKRSPSVGKDNSSITTKLKPEKEEKATRPSHKPDIRESSGDETKEDKSKSNNFYPINWRVVGGGVKIGVNKTEQRRHSEDVSTLSQRFSAFRNPFGSIGEHTDDTDGPSLASAAILKDRAHSFSSTSATPRSSMKTSSLLASRKGADKALSLSLQAYSFSSAATNNNSSSSGGSGNKEGDAFVCNRRSSLNREVSPTVVVVQGDIDEDEGRDGGEMESESEYAGGVETISKLRYHQDVVATTRAKSSPPTPVTAHHQIPNMVFAAESP